MKTYNFRERPIRVYGVPFFDEKKELIRLPEEIAQKTRLGDVARRCPGARLRFRTNAEQFTVRITFSTLGCDIGMSLYGAQAATVFIGEIQSARYAGLILPHNYETKVFEGTIGKSADMEDVTINLPRNEIISDIELIIPDGAEVTEPTPYMPFNPVLYYGSSITEGAHATCNFNAYPAIISTRMDIDYYNFGFSGGAHGELFVADYINELDISVFVYDYDYNAGSPDELEATHESFFKHIRSKHPELPVIMLSRPNPAYNDDEKKRRAIIARTYENALTGGDRNAYFIDGETFAAKDEKMFWSTDTIHPNDWMFHKMADRIEPLIREILSRH